MAKARKKLFDTGDLVTGKARSDNQALPDQPKKPIDDKVLVVLALIDELDSVGLCAVLRHTEHALRPRIKGAIANEPLWYSHVERVLGPLGVPCLPFSALTSGATLASAWRRACLAVQTYTDQLGSSSPAEASRARSLLLSCVLSWMQKCNIPITFKTYIQQMSNISTAVESCFPGYRASGLLGVLIRTKETSGSR